MFGFNNKIDEKDNTNKKLQVDLVRCPQNHPCPAVRVCPTGALKQKGYAAPTVEQEECIKCGKCVKKCPRRALVMK